MKGRGLSGWTLVGIGFIFDVFEVCIEFFMTALGVVAAGATGGAVLGASVCAKVGITATGVCAAAGATLGGLVGVFANYVGAGEAAGAIIGYVLDVMFSIAAFALLFAFLLLSNRLTLQRWMYMLGIFFVKIIPLGNIAPAWSTFTYSCSLPPESETSASTSDNLSYAQQTT